MSSRCCAFLTLLLTLPETHADVRTWTLPDGTSLNAELTGIEKGRVLLRPPNSQSPVTVATSSLNAPDRAAVDEWVPAGRRDAGRNATVQRNAFGWPLTVTLKDDPQSTVVEVNRQGRRFVYRFTLRNVN